MIEIAAAACVVAGYVSLAVELTLLHVPSVASSVNIWAAHPRLVESYSSRYKRLLLLPRAAKLAVVAAPLGVIYAVFAYPLLAWSAQREVLGDHLFQPGSLALSAAAVLIALGRWISLAAAVTLRQRTLSDDDSTLHTSGPFRWSRNPGLIGMYLFAAGLWLTAPSAVILCGIFIYVLHMHVKVLMEEDFLRNEFGERYMRYRRNTPRYVL